ncbi:CCHC-type domain-containing protein [Trichonephila clavipes]|nr:CCHC-type domain-containing protein [Trichonephila clavipes]
MPTEQEAKPAVVTPSLQQWRSPSTFRGAPGEDPLKWLKSPVVREINDTASFIKWCNYIEDMKQKRVGRPRFERLPNVVPVASLTDETDLVSLIRTIKRSFRTVERVLAPVSTKPTETRPRPTYAAVTRKYRAPVQKFPPEPRKTDVWRTADNRPVCFHCGRPGHVMRYCRERKAVFDNSRNRRRTSDDVGTEEEIRRPNSSRRFTPSPTRPIPNTTITDPRRHIADPVSRQAVGARKTKESDLPRR